MPVTKKKLKLLHAVSEVDPFITTGGMGQVAGALTKAISADYPDIDVRVIAPLYMKFRDAWESQMKFLGEVTVELAWREIYCGIFEFKQDGITFYFVDNRDYFDRPNIYGYDDDGERFAFLSKSVFAVLDFVKFKPDVIHSHDWQTALVPIYMKTLFAQSHSKLRSIFTIHNMEYQGIFSRDLISDLFGLDNSHLGLVEFNDSINLVKGAIVACDALTTVSDSYSKEIMSGGGYGLDAIIKENKYKLSGIVNGIDVEVFNPETDKSLKVNYTSETIDLKVKNKRSVQDLFNLQKSPSKMMICVISRLVSHKGVDLITCMMEDLMKLDVQFVLLGTGDHEYELFFSEMAIKYPGKVGVSIAFEPAIASKIYAGADAMLMPSHSEPCGLAQMIGCRYGTIPIVRKVGGLGDTIKDCRMGDGNGFVFEEYSSLALLETVKQAHYQYKFKSEDWKNLMKAAMEYDFSWKKSAKRYAELYRELKNR